MKSLLNIIYDYIRGNKIIRSLKLHLSPVFINYLNKKRNGGEAPVSLFIFFSGFGRLGYGRKNKGC